MGVLQDIIGGVGYALDTPGAYTRGALAGKLGQRVSGRDMLQSWGAVGPDKQGLDWGDAAGFGAEMLFDPLNLVGGGALKALTGANKGIRTSNTASRAMRAAGAMPEEIAGLTKIVDDAGLPKRMYHGTTSDFSQFDMAKANPASQYGRGYYTTDVPQVADSYTTARGPYALEQWAFKPESRDTILQAMNNVDEVTDADRAWARINREVVDRGAASSAAQNLADELPGGVDQYLQRTGVKVISPANVRQNYIDIRNPLDADAVDLGGLREEQFRQMAEAMGHDGIVHRGGLGAGGLGEHNVAIAWDPSQIYAPYIAPRLRPEYSPYPLAAMLAGNNIFRGMRSDQ